MLIWCVLISTSSVTLLLPRLGNSLLVLLSLGSSCWTRVTKHLSIHFKTLSEAEEALQIDYVSSGLDFGELQPSSTSQRSTALTLDNPLSSSFLHVRIHNHLLAVLGIWWKTLLRSQILSHLFKIAVMESGGHEFLQYVKTDLLVSSLSAMKNLFTHGKHTLLTWQNALKMIFLRCLLTKYHLVCWIITFISSQREQLKCLVLRSIMYRGICWEDKI